jgi:RimJ/RimL family protein N-acetyltransferase
MFLRMTEWYIGVNTNFSVAAGQQGKFVKKYLTEVEYIMWLKTYPDAKNKNIWFALLLMTAMFKTFALRVSDKINLEYNLAEQEAVVSYIYEQQKKALGITVLEGKTIALIPVEEKNMDELLSFSADPAIWEHLPQEIYSRDELMKWYLQTKEDEASGKAFPFLIQNIHTREIIGSTRILDLDVLNRKAEIGWTWINPKYFGSKINTEAKLLILNFGFKALGLNRIQLRVDERNIRSRKAIIKIGATFEAILRNFKQRRDGSVGNTYLFSIISSDWELIEKKLQDQIA